MSPPPFSLHTIYQIEPRIYLVGNRGPHLFRHCNG